MNPKNLILVIENNPDHALLIREALMESGYQVEMARSGEEGLKKLGAGTYDFVFLDHGLPGMSGLEVLKRIHATGTKVPVALLTGYGNDELVQEAINHGAYDFIAKSFEPGFFRILPLYVKKNLERFRIEESARESEIKYQTLVEDINEGYFIVQDNKVVFTNQAMVQIMGYSLEEMKSKHLEDFVSIKSLREVYHYLEQQQTTGSGLPERFTIICVRKDGSEIITEVSMKITEYQDRPALIGLSRDVTEKTRIQKELRAQNIELGALNAISRAFAQYPRLEESLGDALRAILEVFDTEFSALCLFDEEPKGFFLQLAGAPEKSRLREIKIPPEHALQLKEMLYQGGVLIRNELSAAERELLARIDFPELPAVAVTPLHVKNRLLGVLIIGSQKEGYFHDHHLKLLQSLSNHLGMAMESALLHQQLEDKVRERTAELFDQKMKLEQVNEELRHAERLRNEFLTNISHELRTPLNAIIGFAQILGKEIGKGPIEQQQDDLQTILQNARSLLELINNILDLTKLHEGTLAFRKESFSLDKCLEILLPKYQPQIKNKGLDLYNDLKSAVWQVSGDREKTTVILDHLLSNAIKFTDAGFIRISSFPRGDFMEIRISDTGVGISKEDQNIIFEEFRQADGASTRRYGGTGLGLAICKLFIQKQGGDIWVDSEPGRGSSFYFTLPLAR